MVNQCKGTTRKGTQCRKLEAKGTGFCAYHQPYIPIAFPQPSHEDFDVSANGDSTDSERKEYENNLHLQSLKEANENLTKR